MNDELLKILNDAKEKAVEDCGSCAEMGTLLDYMDYENLDIEMVENLEVEEYRWFTIELNVYKANFTDREEKQNYYFGVYEVGMLKSEMMSLSDTGMDVEFVPVKKIIKESFEVIDE